MSLPEALLMNTPSVKPELPGGPVQPIRLARSFDGSKGSALN
jgi:hypothetical protein